MRTRTRGARARWRLACGAAAVAAGTLTAATGTGAAAAGELPITQQVQQQDQWCWAASGLTIAKYFGVGNVSQNDFCNLARGYPQGGYCPNQAGQLEWDQRAFQSLGLNPGYVSGPLSFQGVEGEIDGQRPVQTGIYWSAGGGHSQVIYGYDPSSQTISYGDPWPSSPRYSEMDYSSYVSNYQFQWGQALSGIGG
ncbi:papain-like cysteine protease family protein [Actinomadura violacea]|uniref:C39 family peptidase n=1 Tax=Actinomadura violacea TaxID=2819934 RepID=A0ABS3RQ90_9ACTN|nr:papain-like cysteine protease family protein [Actinomadura violacea]MBO2458822.1 C39 family peptidase [Actinomadura violacea]